MKRKLNCLYLGQVFLCLMARYLRYSETWCSFLNFTSANVIIYPVDTERKLNVHKMFRGRSERLLNVLCTFSLRSVSTGYSIC